MDEDPARAMVIGQLRRLAGIEPIPGLALELTVGVTRVGRKRCPSCRRLRVLYKLTAYANEQPVGYGIALCLEDAGLRVHRG